MTDPLNELDPESRRTVRAFIDSALQHSADGMRHLFTKNCEFEGALSAGKLRGRLVVESHYRHAFNGIKTKGATVLRHVLVHGHQVVLDWEILEPSSHEAEPSKGITILDLDDSGLISRIKTEWNPRQILGTRK